jgi:hypothetical protein
MFKCIAEALVQLIYCYNRAAPVLAVTNKGTARQALQATPAVQQPHSPLATPMNRPAGNTAMWHVHQSNA